MIKVKSLATPDLYEVEHSIYGTTVKEVISLSGAENGLRSTNHPRHKKYYSEIVSAIKSFNEKKTQKSKKSEDSDDKNNKSR